MLSLEQELNSKRREFGRNFVFSLLSLFFVYTILPFAITFVVPDYVPLIPRKTMLSCLVATAYIAYLISNTSFNFWSIYRIITATLFGLVFAMSLSLCHKSSAIFMYYIPIFLMILILSSFKTASICAGLIIVLCYFTPMLSESLDIAHPVPSTPSYSKVLSYLEYVVIFFSSCLSFLMLYYYNEFNKIQTKHKILEQSRAPKTINYSPDSIPQALHAEILRKIRAESVAAPPDKFENLYAEIIQYMQDEKPYRDPEFTINLLSKTLKTNATYASRALNQAGNKTFHSLINEYRVNEVKNELTNGAYKKFTMEHIFSKAGFRQQSTFNRIFKEFTGMTPSEFIETKERNDNYAPKKI
jgi:AraC-like DNA-binding protein